MTRSKTKRRQLVARLPRGKNLAVVILLIIAATAVSYWLWSNHKADDTTGGQPITSNQPGSNPPSAKQSAQSFDKTKYSVNDPHSLWVVVNKGRQLPSSYSPADLVIPSVALRYSSGGSEMMMRRDAADALAKMFNAAKLDGIKLMLASGYRSYSTQSAVYGRHVNVYGAKQADRVSARPGHSEHQTGWAVDVEPASRACEIDKCFGELPEGKWLAVNSYKYGFILRYPSGKEELTGYDYEPWHVRYVGTQLANEIQNSGQTLEQFFGLPNYSDYPRSPYQLGTGR